MDSSVVVVPNLLMYSFDQFSDMVEPLQVPKLKLEIAVEGLLVSVLPRTRFATVRDGGAETLEEGFICS